MAELIKKKRSGAEHSPKELAFIVEGFTKGTVPDYQMAAWLMAVYFNGMLANETSEMTRIMLHSGRVLDFSPFTKHAVDKHSTGGVGDKTSMILAPIAAAAGAKVPMIAGRGLGHTGGTLDKLEAIPGFDVDLPLDDFIRQVESIGVAIIGQTDEICPADKKIYALRDVTATVESYPLICASIMSKKLAEGIGALALDVKFGNGAFMKTVEEAETLATKLMEIGTANGKKVAALLTRMDQPLGRFIGNSLEIGECVSILRNEPFFDRKPEDFDDTKELSVQLAGQMIWVSGVAKTEEEGVERARSVLASGAAWAKFKELCFAQGGRLDEMHFASMTKDIPAPESGFVSEFNTEHVGYAALSLGAGRLKTTDPVDATAGIEVHRKLGEEVKKGEPLYTLYYSSTAAPVADVSARLLSATKISLQKPTVPDLIARKRVNAVKRS